MQTPRPAATVDVIEGENLQPNGGSATTLRNSAVPRAHLELGDATAGSAQVRPGVTQISRRIRRPVQIRFGRSDVQAATTAKPHRDRYRLGQEAALPRTECITRVYAGKGPKPAVA